MSIIKTTLLIAVVTLIAGCSARKEIPTNPSGIDEMLQSPCVCNQIDYSPETFSWVG
ncbi:hypothetical protein [Kiloniella laminariae]|uniref:hypothetical protein n=1 Tax=Kiloniella laminariae TaxID=454162 RepID=UPI0003705597|nr:hypothetical protein [Kiloniella laminariae]